MWLRKAQVMKQEWRKDDPLVAVVNAYKEETSARSLTIEEVVDYLESKKDYVVSLKIDGEMHIMHFEKSSELISREGRVRTNFEVTEELDELLADRNKVIAIGELHVVDEAGAPVSYPDAVSILRTPTSATQKRIRYAVFDVLEVDGEDLREKSYWERMDVAKRLFTGKYAFPALVEKDGVTDVKRIWREAVQARGYEGLVITFGTSYGTEEKIKVKKVFTQDLAVLAVEPSESHPDMMGALRLFYIDKNGHYRYAGKVGTGFKQIDRKEWLDWALANSVKTEKDVIWIAPKKARVVEIKSDELRVQDTDIYKYEDNIYKNIGKDMSAIGRKPVFVRIRDDKQPKSDDVRLEQIPGFEKEGSLKRRAQDINMPARFSGIVDKLNFISKKHGYTIYAVGGFVRDLLLGREPKDLDIMVEGPGGGIEFAKVTADELGLHVPVTFPRFGTAMLEIDGEQIEFVMPRREYYTEESRKPETEKGTLEQDALRRDFSINALFLRLNDMEILDLTGHGLKDMQEKIIRVTDPENADVIFSQDPLRMLRAIRQSLQLGFELDPELVAAVKRNADRMKIISKERVRDELSKILVQDSPSIGLRFLKDTGLLKYVLPELEQLINVDQPSKWHSKDVWEHTLKVLDQIPPELVYRLSALLHDIGKPATKQIVEDTIHFFRHEEVGEEMARAILGQRGLKFPSELIDQVAFAIGSHMRPHSYDETWTDTSVRRFIKDLGAHLETVLALSEADATSARPERVEEAHDRTRDLRERIKRVQEEAAVEKIPELVSGYELMDKFNAGPGPWIKQVKDAIADKQLENPNLTKDEALKVAEEIVASIPKETLPEKKSWLKHASVITDQPGFWRDVLTEFDEHIDRLVKIKGLPEVTPKMFKDEAYIFITPYIDEHPEFNFDRDYSIIYNYFKDNSKHTKQLTLGFTAEQLAILVIEPVDTTVESTTAVNTPVTEQDIKEGDRVRLRTSGETGTVEGFASRNETGTDIDVIVSWDSPLLGEFGVSEVHPSEIEYFIDKKYGSLTKKADDEIVQCYRCHYYKPESKIGAFDDTCTNPPGDFKENNGDKAIREYWTAPPICPNYSIHLRPLGSLHKEAYEPDHPEKIKIKSDYYNLNEDEIYKYWKSVEAKLLPFLKDYYVMLYVQADGNVIRKRNDDKGNPIRVATPEDYEKWIATGGTVEVHTVLPENTTKVAWVDIDPKEQVPFEKTKKIAKEIYEIVDEMDNVKDTQLRFSGGRGFHVVGFLNSPADLSSIKASLKEALNAYIQDSGDPKLTLGVTKDPEGIRLDISTLNRMGSIRAPYSLHANTGLAETPLDVNALDSFEKENAKIKNDRTAALTTVPAGYTGSFVIHEHKAEKAGLHWDLRLAWPASDIELETYTTKRTKETPEPQAKEGPGVENVLRSWAIPKATFPTENRKVLAVEVEPHPIAYAGFSGSIPEGYGKGEVDIYDEGSFEIISGSPKKYTIKFNGKNIRGTYSLVNTSGKQWLILKKSEEK